MKLLKSIWGRRIPELFFPMLLSVLAAVVFYNNYFPQLSEVKNGIVGIATYEGVDIDARIKRFYIAGIILVVSFFLFGWLYRNVVARVFSRVEKVCIHTLSLLSLAVLFTTALNSPDLSPLSILFIAISVETVLLLYFLKKAKIAGFISWDKIIVAVSLSCVAGILWSDVFRFAGQGFSPLFFISATVFFYLILLFVFWRLHSFGSAFYAVIPLLFIPALFPFCCEIFLVTGAEPWPVYASVLTGLCIWTFLRSFIRKKYSFSTLRKIAGLVLVVSLSVAAFYQPYLNDWHVEYFELANPANAMMNIFKFHQIPIADFYTSHLLSEQWYGALYFLVHGYNASLDFLSFYFFTQVLAYGVLYGFLCSIFRNAWLAVFFLLFLPFLPEALFPSNYFSILICFLATMAYIKRPGWKQFALLVVAVLFSVVWRVDNAVVALPAVGAVLLAGMYSTHRLARFFKMLIPGFIVVLFFSALGFWALDYTGHNIVGNLKSALEYIGASQAHGFGNILQGDVYRLNAAYFAFPALVLFLCFASWLLYNRGEMNLKTALTISFFTIVYILNFQRGLVRHTIGNEGIDKYFVSFLYFLIPYAVLMLCNVRRQRFWIFVSGSFLFVMAFKTPTPRNDSAIAEKSFRKIAERAIITKPELLVPDFSEHKKMFAPLDSFMSRNFGASASFIDMSNTPLLYYFLQRPVPGYFCQYIQNMVAAPTQARNIALLEKTDVPVAIFSSYPKHEFFDRTDNVENTIRYHKISNYIFNNYRPWGIVSGKYIWVKNDIPALRFDNAVHLPDSVVYKPEQFDIQMLAYLWAKGKNEKEKGIALIKDASGKWNLPAGFSRYKGNYILLEIENTNGVITTLQTAYSLNGEKKGGFQFRITEAREAFYLVPVSTQYNWYAFGNDAIEIAPVQGLTIKSVSLFDEL